MSKMTMQRHSSGDTAGLCVTWGVGLAGAVTLGIALALPSPALGFVAGLLIGLAMVVWEAQTITEENDDPE